MSLQLITTKQVCEIFGVTDRTIYTWRKDKKKPFPKAIFIGGGNRFKQDEVEAYIESLYDEAAA